MLVPPRVLTSLLLGILDLPLETSPGQRPPRQRPLDRDPPAETPLGQRPLRQRHPQTE